VKFQAYERRLYAGLQICGGGYYVMNWADQVSGVSGMPAVLFLSFLAALGLSAAILAIRYLEGETRLARYCMWVWILQIPSFATQWFSYRLFSGAEFRIGFNFTALKLFYEGQFGVGFVARLELDGPGVFIGVNGLALAAAMFFGREFRRVRSVVTSR
jgi:hypothetical protein